VSTSPSGTPPSSVTSSGAVIDETTVMKPVGSPGPMSASLQLVDKKWGTAITVVCQYDQQSDASWTYDLAVIEPPIPKSIRFAEAPAAGRSILKTSRTNKGAQAYRDVAAGLLKRG